MQKYQTPPCTSLSMEVSVKKILLAAAFALVCTAANATCKSDAADKNAKPLAGAALKSFMTKCEKDAKAKCEADSKGKLAGAALRSHVTKCTKDQVGA
jgi:ABC-type molybdate transport system substrate-binding protein